MPYKIRKFIKRINGVWYDFLFRVKFPETRRAIERIKGGGAYNVGSGKYFALFKLLNQFRPKSILELGGGGSTAVFATYAKEAGAKVCSVDQHKKWLENTKTAIGELSSFVEFLLLPAKREGENSPKGFYVGLENKYFDFVYVDGPSFGFDASNKHLNRRTISRNVIDLIESNPPRVVVLDGRRVTAHHIEANYNNLYNRYSNLSLSLSLLTGHIQFL